MSFGDWVADSRRRFREEPTGTATTESVREFADGARNRLHWLVSSWAGGPGYTTTLAGEHVHFLAESPKEVRRARSAINEEEALGWLMHPVDGDTVFWDIGAYHGTYSVIAAAKGATTVAFEPHEENMDRLTQNAALNAATIETRPVALSDEHATRSFGAADTPGSELRIQDGGEKTVQTARGDDIKPAPDVVKIDVEGHERAVLDGLSDTLPTVDRVLVEVHAGVDGNDIRNRLADAGLDVREIHTPRSQTYLGGVRQ